MKDSYQNAEIVLIFIENADVITASGGINKVTNENKTIAKTKIIAQNERETDASKKKGRTTTAIAAGLFGVGGAFLQDSFNRNNRKTEQVITFLVIYSDGSRETVDTTKGSATYQKLIQYLE